jgi:hypothetical protein
VDESLVPELIGVAAQSIVENANRLGLTWIIRLATVVDGNDSAAIKAIYDGDSEPISMVSVSGIYSAEARVYVLAVPPSGNFIIGTNDLTTALPTGSCGFFGSVSGTTTSASFANTPGPITVALTKKYPLGQSQLLFTHHGGAWCNGAVSSAVEFGVTVNGTTFELSKFNFNNASVHHAFGAQRQLDAPAGTVTYTLLWRRSGGTGTITIDGADLNTFSVVEMPIIH